MHGFVHPFGGIDHLLAMTAVGVLASQFTGAQRWLLLVSCLCAMMLGGMLGAKHLALPLVEAIIASSLVAFGVTILLVRSPRLAPAAAIVSAFAVFHGHAHGTEMGAASPIGYSIGLLLATALLHGIGMGLASSIQNAGARAHASLRFAGGMVAIAGVVLLGRAV